ncbi:MAG: hypothetical protein FJX35_25180 [Alphaproteobacteria bacterium]|nr:hypothetical protein [Alphaproteobacteria bacterium]
MDLATASLSRWTARCVVCALRRWLFCRWLSRHRSDLALLEIAEDQLSELGRGRRREAGRERRAREARLWASCPESFWN